MPYPHRKQAVKPAGTIQFKDGRILPFIEAAHDLYINVRQEHIDCAVPGSVVDCAFARAGKEQADIAGVLFHRTVAYVEFAPKNGPYKMDENYVVRYHMSHAMEKQISRFDDTGQFDVGGYMLQRITPGRTLAANKLRATRSRINGPRKAQQNPRRPYVLRDGGHVKITYCVTSVE